MLPPPKAAVKKAEENFGELKKLQLAVPQLGSSLFTQRGETSFRNLQGHADLSVRPALFQGAELRLRLLGEFSQGNVTPTLRPALDLMVPKPAVAGVKITEYKPPVVAAAGAVERPIERPAAPAVKPPSEQERAQATVIKLNAEKLLRNTRTPAKASEEERARLDAIRQQANAALRALEGPKPNVSEANKNFQTAMSLSEINQKINKPPKRELRDIYVMAFEAVNKGDYVRSTAMLGGAKLYLESKKADQPARALELARQIGKAEKLETMQPQMNELTARLAAMNPGTSKDQEGRRVIERARDAHKLAANLYQMGLNREADYAFALAQGYSTVSGLNREQRSKIRDTTRYLDGRLAELGACLKVKEGKPLSAVRGADVNWEKENLQLRAQLTEIGIANVKSRLEAAADELGKKRPKDTAEIVARAGERYENAARGFLAGTVDRKEYDRAKLAADLVMNALGEEAKLRKAGKIGAEAAGKLHAAAAAIAQEGITPATRDKLVEAAEATMAANGKITLESSRRECLGKLAKIEKSIDAAAKTIGNVTDSGGSVIFDAEGYRAIVRSAVSAVKKATSQEDMERAMGGIRGLGGMDERMRRAEGVRLLDGMVEENRNMERACDGFGSGFNGFINMLKRFQDVGNQDDPRFKAAFALVDQIDEAKKRLKAASGRLEAIAERAKGGEVSPEELKRFTEQFARDKEEFRKMEKSWDYQRNAISRSLTAGRYAAQNEQKDKTYAGILRTSSGFFLEAAKLAGENRYADAEQRMELGYFYLYQRVMSDGRERSNVLVNGKPSDAWGTVYNRLYNEHKAARERGDQNLVGQLDLLFGALVSAHGTGSDAKTVDVNIFNKRFGEVIEGKRLRLARNEFDAISLRLEKLGQQIEQQQEAIDKKQKLAPKKLGEMKNRLEKLESEAERLRQRAEVLRGVLVKPSGVLFEVPGEDVVAKRFEILTKQTEQETRRDKAAENAYQATKAIILMATSFIHGGLGLALWGADTAWELRKGELRANDFANITLLALSLATHGAGNAVRALDMGLEAARVGMPFTARMLRTATIAEADLPSFVALSRGLATANMIGGTAMAAYCMGESTKNLSRKSDITEWISALTAGAPLLMTGAHSMRAWRAGSAVRNPLIAREIIPEAPSARVEAPERGPAPVPVKPEVAPKPAPSPMRAEAKPLPTAAEIERMAGQKHAKDFFDARERGVVPEGTTIDRYEALKKGADERIAKMPAPEKQDLFLRHQEARDAGKTKARDTTEFLIQEMARAPEAVRPGPPVPAETAIALLSDFMLGRITKDPVRFLEFERAMAKMDQMGAAMQDHVRDQAFARAKEQGYKGNEAEFNDLYGALRKRIQYAPAYELSGPVLRELSGHAKANEQAYKKDPNFARILEQNYVAKGLEAGKGGGMGIMNVMLEGQLRSGAKDYATLGKYKDMAVSSTGHGPDFVILDFAKMAKLTEQAKGGRITAPEDAQLAYLVPSEAYKKTVLRGLAEAAEKGVITRGKAEELASRLFTYEEFARAPAGTFREGGSARAYTEARREGAALEIERAVQEAKPERRLAEREAELHRAALQVDTAGFLGALEALRRETGLAGSVVTEINGRKITDFRDAMSANIHLYESLLDSVRGNIPVSGPAYEALDRGVGFGSRLAERNTTVYEQGLQKQGLLESPTLGVIVIDKSMTWYLNHLSPHGEAGNIGLAVFFRASDRTVRSLGIEGVTMVKTGADDAVILISRKGMESIRSNKGLLAKNPELATMGDKALMDHVAGMIRQEAVRTAVQEFGLREGSGAVNAMASLSALTDVITRPRAGEFRLESTGKSYSAMGDTVGAIESRDTMVKLRSVDPASASVIESVQDRFSRNAPEGVVMAERAKQQRDGSFMTESGQRVTMNGGVVSFRVGLEEGVRDAAESLGRVKTKGVTAASQNMIGPSVLNLMGSVVTDHLTARYQLALEAAFKQVGLEGQVTMYQTGPMQFGFSFKGEAPKDMARILQNANEIFTREAARAGLPVEKVYASRADSSNAAARATTEAQFGADLSPESLRNASVLIATLHTKDAAGALASRLRGGQVDEPTIKAALSIRENAKWARGVEDLRPALMQNGAREEGINRLFEAYGLPAREQARGDAAYSPEARAVVMVTEGKPKWVPTKAEEALAAELSKRDDYRKARDSNDREGMLRIAEQALKERKGARVSEAAPPVVGAAEQASRLELNKPERLVNFARDVLLGKPEARAALGQLPPEIQSQVNALTQDARFAAAAMRGGKTFERHVSRFGREMIQNAAEEIGRSMAPKAVAAKAADVKYRQAVADVEARAYEAAVDEFYRKHKEKPEVKKVTRQMGAVGLDLQRRAFEMVVERAEAKKPEKRSELENEAILLSQRRPGSRQPAQEQSGSRVADIGEQARMLAAMQGAERKPAGAKPAEPAQGAKAGAKPVQGVALEATGVPGPAVAAPVAARPTPEAVRMPAEAVARAAAELNFTELMRVKPTDPPQRQDIAKRAAEIAADLASLRAMGKPGETLAQSYLDRINQAWKSKIGQAQMNNPEFLQGLQSSARKAVYQQLGIELAPLSQAQLNRLSITSLYEHASLFDLVVHSNLRSDVARLAGIDQPTKITLQRTTSGTTGAYVVSVEGTSGGVAKAAKIEVYMKGTSVEPDILAKKGYGGTEGEIVIPEMQSSAYRLPNGTSGEYGLLRDIRSMPEVDLAVPFVQLAAHPEMTELISRNVPGFYEKLGFMFELSRIMGRQDLSLANVWLIRKKDGSFAFGMIDLDLVFTYPEKARFQVSYAGHLTSEVNARGDADLGMIARLGAELELRTPGSRARHREQLAPGGELYRAFASGVDRAKKFSLEPQRHQYVKGLITAHNGKPVGWGRNAEDLEGTSARRADGRLGTRGKINGVDNLPIITEGPHTGRIIADSDKIFQSYRSQFHKDPMEVFWKPILTGEVRPVKSLAY